MVCGSCDYQKNLRLGLPMNNVPDHNNERSKHIGSAVGTNLHTRSLKTFVFQSHFLCSNKSKKQKKYIEKPYRV